jgi:hypothetical protein
MLVAPTLLGRPITIQLESEEKEIEKIQDGGKIKRKQDTPRS